MTSVSVSARTDRLCEPFLPGIDSFRAFSRVSSLFLSQSTSSKAPGMGIAPTQHMKEEAFADKGRMSGGRSDITEEYYYRPSILPT